MKKHFESNAASRVLLAGILLSGIGFFGCGGGGGNGGVGETGSGSGSGGSNVMSAESALTAVMYSIIPQYLGVSLVSEQGSTQSYMSYAFKSLRTSSFSETVDCGVSGTMTISASPDGNTLTISYNNCKNAGQYEDNGTLVDYEELWNGTTIISLRNIGDCNIPVKLEMPNFKIVMKEDKNADGKWDVDLEYSISKLIKTYSDIEIDSWCDVTSMKVTSSTQESGSITIKDRVKGDNFTIRNLSMTAILTPTRENFNGTMTVSSSCYTASLNIQTIEVLTSPEGEDCPTGGKIKITGGANATYIFTSTGGIQIDLGNDGTIDKTYNKCSEAFSPVCKQ